MVFELLEEICKREPMDENDDWVTEEANVDENSDFRYPYERHEDVSVVTLLP